MKKWADTRVREKRGVKLAIPVGLSRQKHDEGMVENSDVLRQRVSVCRTRACQTLELDTDDVCVMWSEVFNFKLHH